MNTRILAFCLFALTALAVSIASAAEPTGASSPPTVRSSVDVTREDPSQVTSTPVTFAAMARRQPTTATEPPPVSFLAMSQRAPLRAPPPTSTTGPVKPAQAVLNRAPSTKPQFQWQQVCGRRGCSWQLVPVQSAN